MRWQLYYDLLVKYEGDLKKATKEELNYALSVNRMSPAEAWDLAHEMYRNTKRDLEDKKNEVNNDDVTKI